MSMQIIRRIGYMLVVCAIGLNFVSAQTAAADNRADRVEGDGSRLIADSIMKQNPDLWRMENRDRAKWSYVYGLTGTAYLRLHARTQDPRYLNYAKSYADLFVKSDGSIRQYQMKEYNIDHVAVGPLLLGLYKATGEKRYSIASKTLIQQLATHPRTQNGGYWHKKKYPHQIWLDGLFMWMPFASEFSETFKQPHYVDDIVKQQMLVKSKHRDPKTGLYYHGWDESRKQSWSDPETGLSKHFWGRANGWLAMALIESLDYFPKDHPDRQQIIGMARELAVALVQVQDSETGLWYQVLDQGTRKGNYLEGSCTSMFAYFLLKGARMGYLDEVYREKGIEAYEGLWNHLIKQKNEKLILTQVCAVAGLGFGRDGSYEYYINEKRRDNDPKAIGPLILAALEYESLFDHGSAAWEPGQRIPEKIAPIDAPFEMPQLQRPVFKKVDYNILDYGAQKCAWNAAERVLSTDAIRKAIETCNKNGGGRVVIPKGDWITGAVHLKSNVNFHLEEGATLHFSDNPEDYLPAVHVRWEGVECYNYSPLVYAPNCENVAITGKGTLNGHGKKWWALKKKEDFDRIKASAQPLESRQFGLKGGVTSQRPVLLMPWKSKNVLIEGVTLIDPPFWTVQPVYCENVIIRGITIDSRRGHNGDGIDLDSCKNVLIEYNNLQTNDDAVCLKSGLNQDGIQIGIPCENVVVRHFVARNVLTGSGGIVIGSEMSGGVRNVYVHDALFEDCDRGIRMKSTRGRGGIVENIFVEDVTMKNIRQEAFVINTSYAGATQGPAPLFRNIRLKNIRASNVARCIEVKGLADMKVQNIELSDCSFTGRQGATISHAEGVTFNNVTIHSKQKGLALSNSSDCRFTDLDLDGMKPQISDCDNVNVRFASKTAEKKVSRSLEPIASIAAPFEMPQLKRPVFQKKRFRIDAYGGVAGGKIKNTEAIKKAIDACHRAGGGTVVVPQGKWLTGPVHLKSNVQLEVVEGAELIFADQITDYLPAVESAWEGLDCYNYSSLIYAVDCENIGLIGKGRLTCIRDGWKAWDNRPKSHMETLKTLYYQAAEGVPTKERQVANSEARMRPPFIQFLRCKNVLIEGLTIRNSPFWTIHPLKCENVIARDLDIKAHGHNTDGIDPDQTKNMLIEYCTFDQGDDAIVIKAGRNHDGWRGQPSENIVIRHCTIRRGHRFLAMGSEMSGGIRNIYMHDCKLESKGGSVRSLLYLKTNHRRGGFMENIYVKDVTCDKVSSGVLEIETNVLYQWRTLVETVDRKLTTIRNISLENITVGEAQYGIRIKAEKEMPVRNVTLTNVKVGKVLKAPRVLSHVENLKEDRVVFGRNGE